MLADYHVHTQFSDDSVYPMAQVVKDAVSRGIQEICFTDHVDYGIKDDWDSGRPIVCRGDELLANVDYPLYFAQIRELQCLYETQITLKAGLEFGMQAHTVLQYETLFQKYPLDFVILSIHQIDDLEFWTQDFQRTRSQKEYHQRYYEEMLHLVNTYHNYSVLGHMDLIVRYDEKGVYPYEKIRPLVREILQVVIRDGKGIELNTSYHRYGLKDTTPSVHILQEYRELGGEMITIGSDSHTPAHLGAGLQEAKELLKSLGFRFFCTYDKMQPVFHPL